MISLRRVSAVYIRYFYMFFKLDHLCEQFYWPFIDIFLWGMATVWIQTTDKDLPPLALITLTGLVLWQVMWRGNYEVTLNLLQEFWHRNLMNLFATPLKLIEWIVAVMLVGFSKIIVNLLFSAVVVYLLYTLDIFTMGWAFLPYACSLILFGWCVGFLCAGVIIYYGQRLQALAWMGATLFAPFSAIFYPLDAMPEWARIIGYCLPTTYIFEGMRSILLDHKFVASDLIISFVLNGFFLILALVFFYIMFEKSRTKGLSRLE